MAAKTRKLTANRARKLGSLDRSGRCDVSNCDTGNNGFWQWLWGEGMGSRQWAGRHQLWQVNPHFHYRGDQRYRGPIGISLRWCCWRGSRWGTKHTRRTQAGDKRRLMKGLRGPIGGQLGKGLLEFAIHQMVSTPIETLLEGKEFSCVAGSNWTSRKGQGVECMAFGACDIHSSITGTKKGGDRQIHQSILGYQKGEGG